MIALSETAATLVVAACRGWVPHGPDEVKMLWLTVDEYLADQLDDLARPTGDVVPVLSQVDRGTLAATLITQPLHVCQALFDASRLFWQGVAEVNRLAELGIPIPSMRTQLERSGFIIKAPNERT